MLKSSFPVEDIYIMLTQAVFSFSLPILKYLPFLTTNQNPFLTLIRAAGGVYDFQNFEQVKLQNALVTKFF